MTELTPTAKKLYDLMAFETNYVLSGLGYLVFGQYRQDCGDRKVYRKSQGSALAVGRFVSELEKQNLVVYTYEGFYQKSKKPLN